MRSKMPRLTKNVTAGSRVPQSGTCGCYDEVKFVTG